MRDPQIKGNGQQLMFVAIAACVLVAPFILTDFRSFQLTQILVYAVAILGLNLLTGFNGQISLGHGAFFAIGAYVAAVLIDKAGFPYWATIPVAAIVSFAVGFLFGLPALRLEKHYLALATFALALAVPQILKHPQLESLTGGVQGVVLSKPDAPFGLPLSQDKWLYFYVLAHVVVLFLCAANLLRGRIGRAMRAIRDQPVAAETAGIDNALVKTTVFGISAMFTGIAGALGAIVIQFVAPDSFTMFLSIFLLVGVVVGGKDSIWGAFMGAAFIMVVPNVTADISKAATGVIYAAVMILLMYYMPNGLWGGIMKLWKRLSN
ncbi:MAG: branched-chain amino acid ABC transporter permease [Pseudomonadota bacterium]